MERRSPQLTAVVSIRAAVPADAAALRSIEVAAGENFRAIGMASIADDPPPSVAAYRAAIADDSFWVAELEEESVGYAWVTDLSGQPHLEQVSVIPDYQRRGVGSALIERVFGWVLDAGGASLTLSTFRTVEFNGPWYRRRGFVEVPEDEWGTRFRTLRAHEAERGLDVDGRVILRRAAPG